MAIVAAALTALAAPACAAPVDALADASLDVRALLIVGIVVGIVAFAVVSALLFLAAARRTRQAEARALASAGDYERRLDFLNSVLAAEPQLLVHWSADGAPAILADTLKADLGIPRDLDSLLRFPSWLDRDSARELDAQMAQLFAAGEGFNLMLKIGAGGHIEVDGRAAGGGCILKLRDLAGRRQALAEVCEQHSRLGREIDATRALLDALPMPVWFFGSGGALNWVNRAYVRAVDAADAGQVYAEQLHLLSPHDRDAAERRLAGGEPYRARISSDAGSEVDPWDAMLLPFAQGGAGVALPPAVVDDADHELSRHLGAHPRILDRIATAIAVFSPDKRLSYFNAAFAQLWQLEPQWLAGRPSNGELLDRLRDQRDLPEQPDYRTWKGAQLEIYDTGETREEWWHLPDGRALHVVADRAPDGGVTYLYENMTETLALKSRYNALMRVQKETLDHLGEGVAVFGSDGRLKLFNPSFAAIWRLDPEMLQNEPHIDEVIAACRRLHDDGAAWDELKQAVTSIADERERIEGHLERSDGIFLAYAGVPLPDAATLITYVDVTATKRMEKALIERNEALVAADRLKSAFISHVSYELRTPLTNIIGFSEFLQSPAIGPLNDKQREYLSDIRSSSDTLLAIINDILDLATIDAGGLELKIAPATAREIIDAAVLGVRERLTRSNIRLNVDVGSGVDGFAADSRRMTQVLYNLLSNAIGFSEPGSTIALACRRDGDAVEFRVVDEGVGIPEYYQKSVFDRFETRPQGSGHRGAGLGLSIVQSLVELHGGSVTLVSTPNEGTSVTVRIPAGGPRRRATSAPAAAE